MPVAAAFSSSALTACPSCSARSRADASSSSTRVGEAARHPFVLRRGFLHADRRREHGLAGLAQADLQAQRLDLAHADRAQVAERR